MNLPALFTKLIEPKVTKRPAAILLGEVLLQLKNHHSTPPFRHANWG